MRGKKESRYHGVININKPSGMTSHDVVDEVRRIAETRRVGHTGTLDPMATGVLPICVGQATKIAQFLLAVDKEYLVEMVLGTITDSQDTTGKVVEERAVPEIGEDEILSVLEKFTGEIEQIPPMISAKKHRGERLYKLAREGVEVEREPCRITIHELELVSVNLPLVRFRLHCSKGTYVRTLCHDMGEALGPGAAMCGLVRTRCGSFGVNESVSLETLKEEGVRPEYLVSLDEALSCYPTVRVGEREERQVIQGQAIPGSGIIETSGPFEAGSLVRVRGPQRNFLAVARALLGSDKLDKMGANLRTIQPIKVFH
jgi:tRNA pseudouridine55 synthase